MNRTVSLSLLSLALFATPRLGASDARLAEISGKVSIKTGGNAAYEARKGDPIFFGDEVTTEKDALAHVVFKDGTAVLLKGGSQLTIKGRKGDAFLHFNVGEFLIGLKKRLEPGERFRVRTPAAVAAVRGTLFWGLSDPVTKDSTYACFEHRVDITAQGKTVSLDPGQKVKIPFGQAPQPVGSAADIPADYVNTFKVGGTLEGLEALMSAAPAAPTPAPTAAPAPADAPPPADVPAPEAPAASTAPATTPGDH
jgi:hypothetical protein